MQPPTAPIRVVLADDHSLVRSGVRSLLEKMPGVEVVGEASDGQEALEIIRSELPNLVLLDIAMPRLGGLEALPRVIEKFPSVKVLILSALVAEEFVSRALRSGASGYMLKYAAVDELEMAIRAVVQNEVYLSPAISRAIISNYMRRGDELSPLEQLTARQREILQLIAEGMNTKEIAGILDVSVKTVESHRLQLMARLDIYDVPNLVRYAIRNGLIQA